MSCSCSNVPSLSHILTLPLAPAIFMLTFRAQWLQCASLYVAESTAKQGRSCSLASKLVLHVMHNGNVFIDFAVGIPRQMLFMQLVMHAP